MSIRLIMRFNSRAHKGRDRAMSKAEADWISFNSRAHKGRDFVLFTWLWQLLVSIHAPTRGATFRSIIR